jgi:hypothetical protein
MIVRLSRPCSGQEAIDAFSAATAFETTPDRKWNASPFTGAYHYVPNATLSARKIGVDMVPSLRWRRRRWFLFGDVLEGWSPMRLPRFTLVPVFPDATYDEVVIDIEHVHEVDQGGHAYTANDPSVPEFEHIRPTFERLLEMFHAQITHKAA